MAARYSDGETSLDADGHLKTYPYKGETDLRKVYSRASRPYSRVPWDSRTPPMRWTKKNTPGGCNGCKVMNENHWSPDCKISKCARGKGVEACPLCSDYPCEDIMEFEYNEHAHHKSILPNGRRIKAVGLEAWLDEQKERWSCKQCDKAYTWFEESCQSCGSEVLSVQAETGR